MTSIEWLERRFYFTKGQLIDIDFEQAKEIHKQEIIEAYASAVMKENNSDYIGMNEEVSGEIYYQETFKKD
jgi:hypothetical protein